jgi:hypothetical protein
LGFEQFSLPSVIVPIFYVCELSWLDIFLLLSFWRETSQSPGTLIVDRPTNQLLAEELKYSRDRAWRHQRPTNNLLEVWQNLAIFGSRPIGGTVEALLTKVVNQRLSVLPIVVFFVAPRLPRRC